jgi:hypothetical protein
MSLDLLKNMPPPSWDYRVSQRTWDNVIKMMADSGVLKTPGKVDDYMSPQMKAYLVKD